MKTSTLRDFIVRTVWEYLKPMRVDVALGTARVNKANTGELAALTARVTTLETEVAALQASSPPPETASCPMAAVRGDIVYETGADNTVDLADASDPAKMPANWFVASKPTSTKCVLQRVGTIDGLSGLTAGAVYYADPARPGKWITPAPAHVPGQVGQQVCIATSPTSIDLTIALEPPVYY